MCGIFGIEAHPEAANLTYLGLYALQHRGQESAGLVSWDGQRMHVERGMGQVADIFPPKVIKRLAGPGAIGHTRYSTSGTSVVVNAQPIVVKTAMGPVAIVHNGHLTNGAELRDRLEKEGSIFQTTSDTEVILHLMARNPCDSLVESLIHALKRVEGAYSLLVLTADGMIAARDPYGFRPLILGRYTADDGSSSWCVASESCALDLMEAKNEGELAPGEVIHIRGQELERYQVDRAVVPTRCIFEHVYFARPDSRIFGDDVSQVRSAMGATLARESPAEADIVIPVPDSGLFPALGFSREADIPFEFGLIRNHYVGRTFIQPQQSIRDFGVRVKLNPVEGLIRGRRVILVDDSIVRGTTSRKIVRMVRDAGAAEVHLRISSPPTAWPCQYGIDTPHRDELIAAKHTIDEICEYIGADSLAYLSLEGMLGCVNGKPDSYCTACWTGEYRVPFPPSEEPTELFPIRLDAEG